MIEKLRAALALAQGQLASKSIYLTELHVIALEDLLALGSDRHREILQPIVDYWRSSGRPE